MDSGGTSLLEDVRDSGKLEMDQFSEIFSSHHLLST